MTENNAFARLVSLACHDLRTPLATAYGFARTLAMADLEEPSGRYVQMVADATGELGDLLDTLALAARIEAGRYEPALDEVGLDELVQAAADRSRDGGIEARSELAGTVRVDREAVERSLAALARCAQRHGGVDRVELAASGTAVTLSPVEGEAAPIVLGEDLRDLGSAVAMLALAALGSEVELDGKTLEIRLRPA
jgi:signal transduction histidine kinase